jgi:hypothetical protein
MPRKLWQAGMRKHFRNWHRPTVRGGAAILSGYSGTYSVLVRRPVGPPLTQIPRVAEEQRRAAHLPHTSVGSGVPKRASSSSYTRAFM